MRPWMTVEGVYIAAPSKNKDAAYDFVKYVTDRRRAKVMALEGRQTPANKAVYDDPKVGPTRSSRSSASRSRSPSRCRTRPR